jgi:hypothetical protein
MRLPYRALVFAGAVAAWGASPAEARGRPDGNPSALELVDRLQPGIRVPGEPAPGEAGKALASRQLAPRRLRIEGQADMAGGTDEAAGPRDRRVRLIDLDG